MDLNKIGLAHYIKKTRVNIKDQTIGKIFSEHKTEWEIVISDGLIRGVILTSQRKNLNTIDLPKVGDWITYERLPNENKAKIITVLPRYSSLVRHSQKKQNLQTIATNIDIMFVVLSVDQVFNALQLNRYLTIAAQGNIKPVVIINKIDKKIGSAKIISEINSIHSDLKIISVSAKSKNNLSDLEQLILPGRTAVLVGNSGVGKSSLVNVLLKNTNQSTNEVNKFGKGKHTTTRRELFILSNGGIIIDTPGMRTLEVDPDNKSSNSIFVKLDELTNHCKFRNCDHIKSKDCALQDALTKKIITEKQLNQFLNMFSKPQKKFSYNKSRN